MKKGRKPKGCTGIIKASVIAHRLGAYAVFWTSKEVVLAKTYETSMVAWKHLLDRPHNGPSGLMGTPYYIFDNYFFARAFYHHGDPWQGVDL